VTWYGQHRRHQEAGKKGAITRALKNIGKVTIRRTPFVGEVVSGYEDGKEIAKNAKTIYKTLSKRVR